MVRLEIHVVIKPYFDWNGLVGFANVADLGLHWVGGVCAVCKPEVFWPATVTTGVHVIKGSC
jgi:hypothetical protein